MDTDLTDFNFFLHCLKTDGRRMDETSFYFADDPTEAEHLLGYLPQYETPYWVGYCDIPGGCEFRTAEELVNAKIYGGKSLRERWASVRLINVGGIPLKNFRWNLICRGGPGKEQTGVEEQKLRLLTLDQVKTGDTYEFACAHIYNDDDVQSWMFWSPEYRYLEDEVWGIGVLASYLKQVFSSRFNWYGPTKVTQEEWERVERLCLADRPDTVEFFQALRAWMADENRDADYFWILGP